MARHRTAGNCSPAVVLPKLCLNVLRICGASLPLTLSQSKYVVVCLLKVWALHRSRIFAVCLVRVAYCASSFQDFRAYIFNTQPVNPMFVLGGSHFFTVTANLVTPFSGGARSPSMIGHQENYFIFKSQLERDTFPASYGTA